MIDQYLSRMRQEDLLEVIKKHTKSKTVKYIWQQDNFDGEEIICEHYVQSLTPLEFYELKYKWRTNKVIYIAPSEEDPLFHKQLLENVRLNKLNCSIEEILTIYEVI
jgi:hypothetical protein